jgi:hypothetical protein
MNINSKRRARAKGSPAEPGHSSIPRRARLRYQTDRRPAAAELARVSGDSEHYNTRLKEQAADRGIKLDCDDMPPGTVGISRGGVISIR